MTIKEKIATIKKMSEKYSERSKLGGVSELEKEKAKAKYITLFVVIKLFEDNEFAEKVKEYYGM